MSRLVRAAALAVPLAFALAACSSGGGSSAASVSGSAQDLSPIPVVASTNVWGDVAEQVGGNDVQVTSIITNPDQDPHQFEASARNQAELAKARVVVENGGGYDDFVDAMVKTSGSSPIVVNAVDASGHRGSGSNEHVWYEFPAVTKVAGELADALAKVEPAKADRFRRNARVFSDKVAKLQGRADAVKARHAGEGAAVTEPVPLYLLDAMGLVNKTPEAFSAAVEQDSGVPASVLHATQQLFSKHEVAVLVYNAQTSGPETEAVIGAAKKSGVPAVPVTETLPSGEDYISWMNGNITAISNALEK